VGEPVIGNDGEPVTAPLKLIVLWLIFGGLFFTVFMRFINIRGFKHAIGLIRGRYDKPGDKGEVSHFQALTTALSATVGLGNIAGVAIGITIGGPGATFWMILAGLIGMSSKFVECTLGVKYRHINEKGEVSGGAMYYLKDGLRKKNMKWLGLLLAFLFAVLVIGGSVGGGNMFQSNQAFKLSETFFPGISDFGAWYGAGLAFFVGLVIIGGIKSIARVTSKIVPVMALLYVVTALVIIGININYTGTAFMLIIDGAFSPEALKGGFIGVLIYGFQRGAFSNEAGIGSASIAHSAAKTNEPVSEGIVALLEPFVDTVVICTMTALVIIFSGYWDDQSGVTGVQLTSAAFGSVFPWFPWLLLVARRPESLVE
jgi:AGCS family alanine or glycine:cation symporter